MYRTVHGRPYKSKCRFIYWLCARGGRHDDDDVDDYDDIAGDDDSGVWIRVSVVLFIYTIDVHVWVMLSQSACSSQWRPL